MSKVSRPDENTIILEFNNWSELFTQLEMVGGKRFCRRQCHYCNKSLNTHNDEVAMATLEKNNNLIFKDKSEVPEL